MVQLGFVQKQTKKEWKIMYVNYIVIILITEEVVKIL